MLDAREALILWNPDSAEILVRRKGDRPGDDVRYLYSAGAAYSWLQNASDDELGSYLKAEFIAAVVRDNVNIAAAYREFMKIRQFRDAIPADMPEGI